jgi:hypothetical protein
MKKMKSLSYFLFIITYKNKRFEFKMNNNSWVIG